MPRFEAGMRAVDAANVITESFNQGDYGSGAVLYLNAAGDDFSVTIQTDDFIYDFYVSEDGGNYFIDVEPAPSEEPEGPVGYAGYSGGGEGGYMGGGTFGGFLGGWGWGFGGGGAGHATVIVHEPDNIQLV